MTVSQTRHVPVMLEQVVDLLQPEDRGEACLLLDCTLGGGGHAEAMLARYADIFLIGFDRDEAAVKRVRARLAPYAERTALIHGSFADVGMHLQTLPEHAALLLAERCGTVDRVLADLGLSSDQLDDEVRGFSFRSTAALDMRMDPSQETSAADILNGYSVGELRRVFLRGGVGQKSGALAKRVAAARPLRTAKEFAEICEQVLRTFKRSGAAHPATVPFQAVRIEVNNEFGSLERFLDEVLELLSPGGRLAIISFHSLEDRLVTKQMRSWARADTALAKLPVTGRAAGQGRLLTPSAITAEESETALNPRARSARLRVFEKARQGIQ